MLDDHAGDALPRRHRHHRGVDVQEIVERQLLPVELLHVSQARLVSHVQRRALMRVLAVAQRLLPLEHEAQCGRQGFLGTRQVAEDRGVVRGRVGEDFRRERAPLIRRDSSIFQSGDNRGIVVRVDDHDHRRVVLRRRAQHRGATDVDLFDRLCERRVRLRHGFAKRIEVHRHEVDRGDAVLLQRCDVICIVSSR